MTGGDLSTLIWSKRLGILGDRTDRCFHLNSLIAEAQKHKVFDDEVEIEKF